MITVHNSQGISGLQLKQQLYCHKKQIMQEQSHIKESIATKYQQLSRHFQEQGQQMINNINISTQQYYQQVDDIVRKIDEDQIINYGAYLHQIVKLINTVYYQTNLNQPMHLQQYAYSVHLTAETNQMHTPANCNQKHQPSMLSTEQIINKLQQELEQTMLREDKLQKQVVKYQQKAPKKANSKEINCEFGLGSTNLKIQRIQSENAILVQQIASTSRKLMEVSSQNSVLKHELQNIMRSATNIELSTKVNLSQYLTVDKKQADNEQIIQIQQKNLQLQNQIANKQIQLQILKQQYQKINRQLQQKNEQLKVLIQQNQSLSADYELSCRKKHKLQQQCLEINNLLQNVQQKYKVSEQKMQGQIINQTALLQLKEQNIRIAAAKIAQLQGSQLNRLQEIEKYKLLAQTDKHSYIEIKQERDNIRKDMQKVIDEERQKYKRKIQLNQAISHESQNEQHYTQEELRRVKEELQEQKQNTRKLEAELSKMEKDKKDKEGLKKEIKNVKKQTEEIKKEQQESFNVKYGMMVERIQMLKEQTLNKQKMMDRKFKVMQSRLGIMKDKFQHQLLQLITQKQQKTPKKNIVQIIQKYTQTLQTQITKQSQIKQLKEQLHQLKQKKNNSNNNTVEVIDKELFCNYNLTDMEQKTYKQIVQIEVQTLQETIKEMNGIIEKLKLEKINISKLYEEQTKKGAELQKIIEKGESNKLKEVNNTQSKLNNTEEKLKKVQADLKITKIVLKKAQNDCNDLQMQLKTKKQLIIGLKNQIKDKDSTIISLKEKLNTLNEQLQRVKKHVKDIQKKQAMFRDMKEKLQGYKQIESEYEELKRNSQEKQKLHKFELLKKESQIKELRQANGKDVSKVVQQQCVQMQQRVGEQKEKIRKLKAQLDRKESLYNHQKQKMEKNTIDIEEEIGIKQKKMQEAIEQLQRVQKKLQSVRMAYRKQETKAYLLKTTIKKLYETFLTVYINKSQVASTVMGSKIQSTVTKPSPEGLHVRCKYLQGLQILQLTEQDLSLEESIDEMSYQSLSFSSPMGKQVVSIGFNMKRMQQLLSDQDMNMQQIIKLFVVLMGQNI